MNNIFKKGCNLVKYQTYNNIKNGLIASGMFSFVTDMALTLSGVNISNLSYVSSLFCLVGTYLQFSKGVNYTKDVNELRVLYNEFIRNYNKMNSDFGNNNPLAIYTMFHFLLNNGYLSVNKTISFNNDDCYNLFAILGTDIIRGNGVCRHIASMFTDIMNDYGIPSINTVCYVPNYDYDLVGIREEDYSREDNIRFIENINMSLEERERLIRKIIFLEENNIYLSFKVSTLGRDDKKIKDFGNHLITYSCYQEKSYYFDSTRMNIYRLSDINKGIVSDKYGMEALIRRDQFCKLNDLSDREIKGFIEMMREYPDSISLMEEREIITSVRGICEDNMDIFELFYKNNMELYGEIVNKLVKIKKKG